jgi:hypothetical protein
MHIDFAHAAVAAILIFLTVWIMNKTGLSMQQEEGKHVWDWKIFTAVFVVILVLNLIWPYGS